MRYTDKLKPRAEKDLKSMPKDDEEFVQIQEALEDLEDLRELRKEREETMDSPSRRLREIGKELGFEQE
jgi:hypothetical protein